ncbi:hypothetical protein FQR65_LT10825 [Abscondita terminalis]|nr:hypothetical protein FQR65_LT10825 [Abscondita terminalis]
MENSIVGADAHLEVMVENVETPKVMGLSLPMLTGVEFPALQLLLQQQQMMLKFMEEQKGINRQLLGAISQFGVLVRHRYFNITKLPKCEKLSVVTDCLQGVAEDWMIVKKPSWRNYEQFYCDFVNHFWSEEKEVQVTKTTEGWEPHCNYTNTIAQVGGKMENGIVGADEHLEVMVENVETPKVMGLSEPMFAGVESPALQLLLQQQQMMLKFMEEQKGINRQLLGAISQIGVQNGSVVDPTILSFSTFPVHVQSLWSVVSDCSLNSAIEFLEKQVTLSPRKIKNGREKYHDRRLAVAGVMNSSSQTRTRAGNIPGSFSVPPPSVRALEGTSGNLSERQ